MLNIIMNERRFAEDALARQELGSHPNDTLKCVARYYHAAGYNDDDVKSKLVEFLLRCDSYVNLPAWEESISHFVKSSGGRELVEIDCVPITQKELDVCESLRKYGKSRYGRNKRVSSAQKLLFTLICLAKFYNASRGSSGSWVFVDDKEIFKLANISVPADFRGDVLKILYDEGLIKIGYRRYKLGFKVLCVDPDGDAALTIFDFRNLGNQLAKHCGEQYMECQNCGLVVKRITNNQRYCKECGEEVNREKTAARYKRK